MPVFTELFVTSRSAELRNVMWGRCPIKRSIDGVIAKRIPAVAAFGVEDDGKGASVKVICRVAGDIGRGDSELARLAPPFERPGSATTVVTLCADGSILIWRESANLLGPKAMNRTKVVTLKVPGICISWVGSLETGSRESRATKFPATWVFSPGRLRFGARSRWRQTSGWSSPPEKGSVSRLPQD